MAVGLQHNDTPMDEFRIAYKFFILFRFLGGIVVTATVAVLWQAGVFDFDPTPILVFIMPFYLVVNGLWYVLGERGKARPVLVEIELAIDILLITIALYISGGTHSEVALWYLIPIISATTISFPAAFIGAIAAVALYGTLLYLETLGLVGSSQHVHAGFHADEVVRLIMLFGIMAVTALQSRYFLAALRRRTEELFRARNEFFFKAVHGLRSPLTIIRWLLDRHDAPERSDAHLAADDIKKLQETNAQMSKLVTDLLAVVRGDIGARPAFRPVALPVVLRELIASFQPAFAGKNIRLEYAPAAGVPAVLGDPASIKEIFGNLLDNAVKYSTVGGTITITHAVDGNILRTAVADTGRGIAPDDAQKMFTPYFRGKGSEAVAGTGLGLYIVKQLVDRMGGSVAVSSAYGKGSTFTVSLPVVHPALGAA